MSNENFGRSDSSQKNKVSYDKERRVTMKKIEAFLEELFESFAHVIEY